MSDENQSISDGLQMARIAVYDDFLSAPRIVDIPPTDIANYIEQIAAKTYELAQSKGSVIPYTVIREVSENFIHAQFKEPTVSILDNGNTIRFADQGPGIEDKEHAQMPGFTSATGEMKEYIRGVGSGLPIVKEYLRFSNGRLIIEDNIKEGTVITIKVNAQTPQAMPVVYQETAQQTMPAQQMMGAQQTYAQPQMGTYQQQGAYQQNAQVQMQPQMGMQQTYIQQPIMRADIKLNARERDVLSLANEMGVIGPTEINTNLGLSVSTAYRILNKLEELGLVETTDNRKRMLTDAGYALANE